MLRFNKIYAESCSLIVAYVRTYVRTSSNTRGWGRRKGREGGRTRSWSRCFGNKAHAIVGARNLWTWSKLRLRLHNSTSVDRYERNGQSHVILSTVHVTWLRDRNSKRLDDPTLDQPVRPPYRVLSRARLENSRLFFPPFFSFLFFSFLVFLVSMTRFPSGGSPRGRANGGTISIEVRRIRVARILFGDGFKISSWLNGIRRRLAWRRTCVIRGNCTRRDLGRYF